MDFLSNVLAGLLTNWVQWVVSATTGVVIAVLRRRDWPWATPIALGIGVGVAVFVGLVGLRVQLAFSDLTSDENIESHIRDWSDRLGYGIKRKQVSGDLQFNFDIALTGGSVSVFKEKSEGVLNFASSVSLGPTHTSTFDQLPERSQKELIRELRLEMMRQHIDYQALGLPLRQFTIGTKVPINQDLTEREFIRTLEDVKKAVVTTREFVQLRLD